MIFKLGVAVTLFYSAIPRVNSVRIYNSISSQLPPLARLNQSYSFTLLPNTFVEDSSTLASSDPNSILYTAHNLPSWLSFSPLFLTFSGHTPSVSETDGSTYFITVTGNSTRTGTSSEDTFTLILVTDPAPKVKVPLSSQLERAAVLGVGATLQSDGTLRVPPTWSFSLGFEYDTFIDPQGWRMFYQAYERGTTKLPSWITFDQSTVTFDTDRTPDGGVYTFDLYGSNRQGHGDVKQSFTIHVSRTEALGDGNATTVMGLQLADPEEGLRKWNTTRGSNASYTVDLTQFKFQNRTLESQEVEEIQVDLSKFSFLSYDSEQRRISGVIPSSFNTNLTNIPLTLMSTTNASVSTSIPLSVFPSLFFNPSIPSFNVSSGQSFTSDIQSNLVPSSASHSFFSASFTPTSAADWMSFDSSKLLLSGKVPDPLPNYDGDIVKVAFVGIDNETQANSTASLIIDLLPSTTNGTDQPTASPISHSGGLSRGIKVAIGLSVASFVVIVVFLILIICCRRKREKEPKAKEEVSKSEILNISYPLAHGEGSPNRRMSSSTAVGYNSSAERLGEKNAGGMVKLPMPPELAHLDVRERSDDVPRRMEMLAALEVRRNVHPLHPSLSHPSMRLVDRGDRVSTVQEVDEEDDSISAWSGSDFYSSDEIPWREDGGPLPSSSTIGDSRWFLGSSEEGARDSTESERKPRSIPRRRKDFAPPRARTSSRQRNRCESGAPQLTLDLGGVTEGNGREAIRLVEGSGTSPDSSMDEEERMKWEHPIGSSIIFPSSSSIASDGPSPTSPTSAETRIHGDKYSPSMGQPRLMRFSSKKSSQGGRAPTISSTIENVKNFRSEGQTTISSLINDIFEYQQDEKEELGDLIDPMFEDSYGERSRKPSNPYQPNFSSSSTSLIFDVPPSQPFRTDSLSSSSFSPPSPTSAYSSQAANISHDSELIGGLRLVRTSPSPDYSSNTSSPNQNTVSDRIHGKTNSVGIAIGGYNVRRLQMGDILTMSIAAGEPFHFSPPLNPPPSTSMSSTGRLTPYKSAYRAVLDYPNDVTLDGKELPDWLNFDQRLLELWGIPISPRDIGSVAFRIIEKKREKSSRSLVNGASDGNSSPKENVAHDDEMEVIVGRFIIQVDERSSVSDVGMLGGFSF